MSYFNPNKTIILQIEVSFYEGLNASLFQKGPSGQQPVHFISRILTDTEKQWAVDRLRNSIIGTPIFTIITAHKFLIPMFNKVTFPPHIQKWIMETTTLDFKLKYKPVRNELDPHYQTTYQDTQCENIAEMAQNQ